MRDDNHIGQSIVGIDTYDQSYDLKGYMAIPFA